MSSECETLTLEWPSSRIRQTFFDYFEARGHTYVKGSSVLPDDDPTLLFTNAGMNQFKKVFQGTVAPKVPRAYNAQNCIRAGGKHNDLDAVGKDNSHHSFFEMLGNWSFNDYFRKEALDYSWKLLTEVYKLDKNRLYVTYFEGNPDAGLDPDLETRDIWLSFGLEPSHVIPGNAKDNFWEMGPTGPCGPSSEIHFDMIGGGRNASELVNHDDPTVLEIWNNVFVQFNREADGSLTPLPARHVDTGLGFERLVSALQGTLSNYDTDLFTPLLQRIHEFTGVRQYTGKFGETDDPEGIDTAYRVLADHVRMLTFAISDGCEPSSNGQGYVVRRILRRGVRYAHSKLNAKMGSFFSSLAPTVVEQFGDLYPELKLKFPRVKSVLDDEEALFSKTLGKGEKLFKRMVDGARFKNSTQLDGKEVWKLYDTYGFPVDLTMLMAEEIGFTVNEEEVEAARLWSKEASRRPVQN